VALILRDADSRDFETLWRIDQECFAPGIAYSRRELAAFMAMRGAFTLVIADEDAQILGFLVAMPQRNGIGHVMTIDVVAEARRRGVGSKLLATAEGRLRQLKCRVISLETAVDNSSAITFYEHHQYSAIKTIPGYYSNGVDALLLEKDLLSTAQAS
jgi:ribosomal-protein-alanine N-acetyltransferase